MLFGGWLGFLLTGVAHLTLAEWKFWFYFIITIILAIIAYDRSYEN